MGETFPFNLTPGTDCPRWPLEVWVREAAMFEEGDVNALPDIFCHRGFVTTGFCHRHGGETAMDRPTDGQT